MQALPRYCQGQSCLLLLLTFAPDLGVNFLMLMDFLGQEKSCQGAGRKETEKKSLCLYASEGEPLYQRQPGGQGAGTQALLAIKYDTHKRTRLRCSSGAIRFDRSFHLSDRQCKQRYCSCSAPESYW